MPNLQAICLGRPAQLLLNRVDFEAEVWAVFNSSCGLLTGAGEFLGLVCPGGLGPLNLVVPGLTLVLSHLEKGMPARASSCLLTIPAAGVTIDCRHAQVWEAHLTAREGDPREALRRLSRVLARDGTPSGGLAPLLLWAFGQELRFPPGTVLDKAQGALALLREGLAGRRSASVSRAIPELVGLGPGLTPSGDDVLSGLMATFHLLGPSFGLSQREALDINTRLLAGVQKQTTLISWHQMRWAACGQFSPQLLELLDSLQRQRSEVSSSLLALTERGASSGWDVLLGVVWALRCLSDRVERDGEEKRGEIGNLRHIVLS